MIPGYYWRAKFNGKVHGNLVPCKTKEEAEDELNKRTASLLKESTKNNVVRVQVFLVNKEPEE